MEGEHAGRRDLSGTEPEPVSRPRRTGHGRSVHLSGYARKPRDFYATPEWVTEALLRHVPLRGPVWEPCCGTGAISSVLEQQGHRVVSTAIADHGYGTSGVDIFGCAAMPEGCRALVTNPPYGDTGSHAGQEKSAAAMLRFVHHCLALAAPAKGQVALLVRFQWIAGKRASALMSAAPWAAVIALTHRIRWFEMGERTNTAQHHHAWVVFDFARPDPGPPALLFAD